MKATTRKDILEEARILANSHKLIDPATSRIICYSKDTDTIIRLLEVSKEVPPSGCVFAVTFAPGNGVGYPSSIILLNPSDYRKIKEGKLSLPEDWGDFKAGNAILGKAI
jgi:hypothetical protein